MRTSGHYPHYYRQLITSPALTQMRLNNFLKKSVSVSLLVVMPDDKKMVRNYLMPGAAEIIWE